MPRAPARLLVFPSEPSHSRYFSMSVVLLRYIANGAVVERADLSGAWRLNRRARASMIIDVAALFSA